MQAQRRRPSSLVLMLLLSSVALLPTLAVASVPRADAPANEVLAVASLGSSSAPAAALDIASLRSLTGGAAPSALAAEPFALFVGDELAPRARSSGRELHALQGISLLSEEPHRGSPPRFPETRIGVFEFLGGPLIGVERALSLELRWGSGFSCFGTAEGSVKFGQEDPVGTVDSPNRYQALGGSWTQNADPDGHQRIRVEITSFIPDKRVKQPGRARYFAGDGRGFNPDATSYRTRQSFTFETDPSKAPNHGDPIVEEVAMTSGSTELDRAGHPIGFKGTDLSGIRAKGTFDEHGNSTISVKARGSRDPFVDDWGTGIIDVNYDFQIQSLRGAGSFVMVGSHVRYPSFEIYATFENGRTTVYQYDSKALGLGPADLLPILSPTRARVSASCSGAVAGCRAFP